MDRVENTKRRFDAWSRRIAFGGFAGLLAVAIATMTDVLARWLFNSPIEGLEDAALLCFGVIVIACLPAGLIQGHNVTIRFLGRGLGRRADHWLEVFGAILTLVFFVFVAWQFVDLTIQTYETNDTSMTVEIPTWPFWALGTVLLVFCVPVQVLVLIGNARRARMGRGAGGTIELQIGAREAGARAAEDAAARRGE